MKLRNVAGLLILALLAVACTTDGMAPTAPSRVESVAVTRGRSLAEVRCSGCHAIAGLADSPRIGAPSFGQVRLRYNALSWPRVMGEIAEGRHREMPPITLTPSEVEDLRAYIETLR